MDLFDTPPPAAAAPLRPASNRPGPARPSPARIGLFALAVLYTLYFTHDLVLPILISALLALLLAPVVRRLRRLRLPGSLAAALMVVLLAGGVGFGAAALASPAADWLQRAPDLLGQIERKLRPVRQPVEEVRRATEQVQRMAAPDDGGGTVKLRRFDLGEIFVVSVTKLATQSVVVLFLVYFLLSSGPLMMRRLMAIPAGFDGRRRVASAARAIERDVTLYLGMVTLINGGLGLSTGLAMWALGMPNPALWGALAWILNYMPYVGPGMTMGVLAVVGVLSFDHLGRGLLPAAVFLGLANIEGNLITPTLVGRRLTLAPLTVFLSLLVWSWMWGVAGALLATPILVVLKVTTDHVEALRPLSGFLGNGDPRAFARRRR